MRRRSLIWVLLLMLVVGLIAPAATRAEMPLIPVILVHGQGGTPEFTWKDAVPYLEERGYQVGVSLFPVDLPDPNELQRLGVLRDADYVVQEIHRVQAITGARRVDLVGHSRGGLVVRLVAGGETADLVRRAVSIAAPHEGALSFGELEAMVQAAGLPPGRLPKVAVPTDLQEGSMALQTLFARERRFSDRMPTALAIGVTWQEGTPSVLYGNDGAVSVRSQLAWPGARTALFRLGPTPAELQAILRSDMAPGLLLFKSPHMQAVVSRKVLATVADFLLAPKVAEPMRPCAPNCRDWDGLIGHPAEGELKPFLSRLPFAPGPGGQRLFEPDRPMSRAEWLYGLCRAMGLEERLGPPAAKDLEGHWAAGWFNAAVAAGLVQPVRTFRPDEPATRGFALAMLDPENGLGSTEPLTLAEGSLLLVHSVPHS